MSYEVTKHIKGGTYRYRVDTVHDPQTGAARARWRYLGRLDGERLIAPQRPARERVTRDEIVAITAQLLESRDASRVTVSVIARHAGISPGTFYRQFGDRRSALIAALVLLGDRLIRELPSLAGPVLSRNAERERFSAWFDALHRAAVGGRACRWFLTQADDEMQRDAREQLAPQVDPHVILAGYLQRLAAAGHASVADAQALATSLLAVHAAVVRDVVAGPGVVDAAAHWSTIFPVLERAVFSTGGESHARAGKVALTGSQSQARDGLSNHHGDHSTSA
jgi:AcrR family transcriptional regulator